MMKVTTLVVDDAVREIAIFIEIHRVLYGIVPGTPQPPGIGEEWGVLKQRIYGTLSYERNDSSAWADELGNEAQKAETLAYVREKTPRLLERLREYVDRLRTVSSEHVKVPR